MEGNASPPNVFNLITDDIPRDKFNTIVQTFRKNEAQFTEYLDTNCNQEEYLTKENMPEDAQNELFEIRSQNN